MTDVHFLTFKTPFVKCYSIFDKSTPISKAKHLEIKMYYQSLLEFRNAVQKSKKTIPESLTFAKCLFLNNHIHD